MADNANGLSVARILYKEIVPGDLRKIEARSNDSDSGGGARDFRFGSYAKLLPAIRQIFPDTVQEDRKRGSSGQKTSIFQGTFHWIDSQSGHTVEKIASFEPPTDARPSEGRIARVHEYACFDLARIPPMDGGNRVLLLLVQRQDNTVWPHFIDEKSLRTPEAWEPLVASELLKCLDAKRARNKTVIGYIDFTNQSRHCNGK